MNARTRKALIINGVWIVGFLGAVGGLAWGSLQRLDRVRSGVAKIEERIQHGEALVAEKVDAQSKRQTDRSAESLLDSWSAMTDSQSDRVAVLSRAAQRAGVQLSQMRSFEPTIDPDSAVLECPHEVTVIGGYRQLGRFLSTVQGAPGLVSIEDLVVTEHSVGGASDLEPDLRASMWVRWYAATDDARAALPGGA